MVDVSIIIPCYNSGELVKKAVDSALQQTYQNIEVVVVDDGSDDVSTKKCLEELTEKITVIQQSNKGLSGARNTGIMNSQGKYIVMLDADDSLSPEFLEKTLSLIKNTKCSFVYTHMYLFGEKNGILKREFNSFQQLFLNRMPYCILIEKEIISKLNGYDENMKKGFEDWEFNIRLIKNNINGILCDEALFHYYVSNKGMLKSITDNNYMSIVKYIRQKHKDIYNFKNILALYFSSFKSSQLTPSKYPPVFYLFFYIATEILPQSLMDKLYKTLLKFRKSENRNFAN